MKSSETGKPRRSWTVLGAGIALAGIAVSACGTTSASIVTAEVNPDFTANGPLVTDRIAPSDAPWAEPGEHQLNLQSPLIHTVFQDETRDIPLPPGATYDQVYGTWIGQLTSPGMTQHTRTEIRAEATNEALIAWLRYWLSATPAERKATKAAMEKVTTSSYLDRRLGKPTVPTVVRVEQMFAAARAGNTAPMREWISLH